MSKLTALTIAVVVNSLAIAGIGWRLGPLWSYYPVTFPRQKELATWAWKCPQGSTWMHTVQPTFWTGGDGRARGQMTMAYQCVRDDMPMDDSANPVLPVEVEHAD